MCLSRVAEMAIEMFLRSLLKGYRLSKPAACPADVFVGCSVQCVLMAVQVRADIADVGHG